MELKLKKSGVIVIIKDYLTGGDWENIQDALAENLEFDPSGKGKLSGGALKKYTQAKLQVAVTQVGDKTENLLQELQSLPVDDYLQVVNKTEELVPLGKEMTS